MPSSRVFSLWTDPHGHSLSLRSSSASVTTPTTHACSPTQVDGPVRQHSDPNNSDTRDTPSRPLVLLAPTRTGKARLASRLRRTKLLIPLSIVHSCRLPFSASIKAHRDHPNESRMGAKSFHLVSILCTYLLSCIASLQASCEPSCRDL
jgi:hypothetical protein